MPRLVIEKYDGNVLLERQSVPSLVLAMLDSVLPPGGVEALERQGIAVSAFREASREGRPYSQTVDIKEKGQPIRMVITLD
ncbi:hypothetical protein [uncultured Aquitalea sp.]|uniref:hypothetical protein n=1 Tax=uncultured Aquitalea sp. TaxID=540272 RepID=UPI0025D4468F|nr:hypothetical protein [uncultured Aquitalea sp.]